MEETNVDELEEFKGGEPIDVTKYEGQKAKIEEMNIIEVMSDYDDNGVKTPGLQRPVKVLKISTECIEKIPRNGEDIEIKASELFNLKVVNGKIGWSSHKKSKIQKFLTRMGVSKPSELKGKDVTILVRPVGENNFLGFAV